MGLWQRLDAMVGDKDLVGHWTVRAWNGLMGEEAQKRKRRKREEGEEEETEEEKEK